MKKIGRLRMWLIRKLGGEILLPTKPVIIEKVLPTKTLRATIYMTEDEKMWFYFMNKKDYEEKTKKRLWEVMGEQAIFAMSVEGETDEHTGISKITGTITIVSGERE